METTLVPFPTLPCASGCQPLWDANGGCVPPGAPTAAPDVYASCFCSNAKVSPLVGNVVDICGGNCPPEGLTSIHNWLTGYCNNKQAAATNTGSSTATGSRAAGTSGASSGGGTSQSSGGGDWLSTHWQWVIFIVVVFVAIVGIWVGACIWRRRYLKKKDRMYELGKGLPSNVAVNTQGHLVGPGVGRDRSSGQPMLAGPLNAPFTEKPKKERKRWNVTERT